MKTEQKWTSEPWQSVGHAVKAPGGDTILELIGGGKPYNANRLAACVNACAGIEDPVATVQKLRRINHELISALRYCLTSTGATCWKKQDYANQRIRSINETARAAIALAEGRGGAA